MSMTYALSGFAVWIALWLLLASIAIVIQLVLRAMAKRSVMKASDSVCEHVVQILNLKFAYLDVKSYLDSDLTPFYCTVG